MYFNESNIKVGMLWYTCFVRQKSFRLTRRCQDSVSRRNDFMTRKDSRGRNLKVGESQRKDGLYMYRYTDEKTGKRLTIYDADLASLRVKEKQISKDMDEDIVTDQAVRKMTVNMLFERYMESKQLAQTTKVNYLNMWNLQVKEAIGYMKVVQVKPSHIK